MVGLLAMAGIKPLIAAKGLGIVATLAIGAGLYVAARELVGQRHALITAALYLLLPNVVAYTVGGLETPVYTMCCAMALIACQQGKGRWSLAWAAAAAIMRPDGMIVFGVVLLGLWCQLRRVRPLVRPLLTALAAIALYYAIHYCIFGTLVPQTMITKGQVYRISPLLNVQHYLHRMFLSEPAAIVLALLAAVGIVPAVRRQSACVWLAVWYILYHLAFMLRALLFPWYLQPPIFVLAFFAGIAVSTIVCRLACRFSGTWIERMVLSRTSTLLVLLVLLAIPGNVVYARGRRASNTYDESVRGALGRWLNVHAASGELVFTESLGYIGYYNDQPFVDWPGLVAPDVPALIKGVDKITGFARIIEANKPIWLAIRSSEWRDLRPEVKSRYALAAKFSSSQPNEDGYVVARRLAAPTVSTAASAAP
jgi:hypothetical protein